MIIEKEESSTKRQMESTCINCSQPIDPGDVNSYNTFLSSSDDDDAQHCSKSVAQLLDLLYKLKYLKSCPIYSTTIVDELNWRLCNICADPLSTCYEFFLEFDALRAADSFLSHDLEKLDDCFTTHHHQRQEQTEQLIQPKETEQIKQEINFDILSRNCDNNYDDAPVSPISFNDDNIKNNSVTSENQSNGANSSLNSGPWVLLKRLEDEKIPVNIITTTSTQNTRRRRSENVERVAESNDEDDVDDDEDYEPLLKKTRVSKSKQPVKSRPTRKNTSIASNDVDDDVVDVKIKETITKSKTSENVKIKAKQKESKSKKSSIKCVPKKKKPKEKRASVKNENASSSTQNRGRGRRTIGFESDDPRSVRRRLDYSYKKKKMMYPNPCWYCDKHFPTQLECFAHTKETHSEADDWICDECAKIIKDNNQSLMRRHKQKDCVLFMPGLILPAFSCPHELCSKKYPDARALDVHVNRCHGNIVHICPYSNEGCTFKSKNTSTLTSHVHFQHKLSDADKFTFKCEECNKFFKTPAGLRAHKSYLHTEEGYRKYKKTARAQLDKEIEQRKVKREERLKDHICAECNVNCFTNFALVFHNKKYHSQTAASNFVCEQCGSGFRHQASFKHHTAYAHVENKGFICDQCGKEFKNARNLKDHCRRTHSDEGRLKYNAHMRLHHQRRKYRAKQIEAVTSNKSIDLNIPPELTATNSQNTNVAVEKESGNENDTNAENINHKDNNTHYDSNSISIDTQETQEQQPPNQFLSSFSNNLDF